MKAGRFVGRVGGLAVALGVGAAVSLGSSAAWADDTGSANSDGATGSAGATGTAGAAESQGTSVDTETTTEPAGTGIDAETEAKGDGTAESGRTPGSAASESTDSSVRQTPPGIVLTTGGAQPSTESINETSSDGDAATDSTTDEPVSNVTTAWTNRGDGRPRAADQAGARSVNGSALAASRTAAPSGPNIVPIVSDDEDRAGVTENPTIAIDLSTPLPPKTNAVAVSAPRTAQTEPTSAVSAIVLAALGTAVFGPLVSDGPLTPVDSPMGLALLAVGARSRSIGQSAEDGQNAAAAMLSAAAVSAAPTAPVQPVGTPDPVTGVVTGTVIATDPDNNTLTYTVASGPTRGTVALNTQTGAYTYTPTYAARLAAGTTPTADTDIFTVAVSDGQQSTTAAVSVYVSPLRLVSQPSIPVGTNPSAVVVSPDGRMFVVNTGSKSVSVINTATGQRIDANRSWYSKDIGVGSSPSALALSADGKRLYVANTGSGTVSVIDTATYKRIDANRSWFSKDIKVGKAPTALAFGPDGRLYVANRGANTVSVINTATNQLVDINPNVSGVQSIAVGTSPSALALGTDGRLYVANRGANTVSVINTGNSTVTHTITVGSQPAGLALGTGGRLYVTNAGSGSVSVIDTANGFAVRTIPVGPSPTSVALHPNGGFAYVANANDTVSLIDTATYKVVSTTAIDSDTTGGHVIAVSPNGTVYVTDAADKTVRVLAVRYGNTAPVAGTPTVGTPNTANGAVTGALNFTDADGDTLSYSLTQPSTGTVSITSAGVYTFTPTLAARQATTNGGPTSTSFTVTASDGQATTSVRVTVPIASPVAASRVTSIGSVSVPGFQIGSGPVLTADGTRALITTYVPGSTGTTTRVAVVNTTTGKQVGSTLTLTGSPGSPVLSADGTRALITTSTPNPTTGITTTRVTVINTATGAQIGTTVAVAGDPWEARLLGTDGRRALILTDIYDVYDWDGSVTHSTGVAVIDTTTGAQIGTSLTLADKPSGSLVSDDGTHVLVFSSPAGWEPTGTTGVTAINTTTATQIGTTLDIAGNRSDAILSPNGIHALITTTAGDTTRVTVVNITTGAQTGATAVVAGGYPSTSLPLSPDAGRVLVTTRTYDSATGTETTNVAVVNTVTGSQTGPTFSVVGSGYSQLSADGTRALITTTEGTSDTGFTSRVAVFSTTTGTQIGSTLTLTGAASSVLSADGSRALITTSGRDANNNDTARVAVIDTSTGLQTFAPLTLTGQSEFGSRLVGADGTRALIVTNVYDGRTSINTTRLTMIDTATGAQVGTTTTLTGFLNGGVLISDDSRRIVVTTVSSNFATTGKATTQVAVLNTISGTQVGSTLTLDDDTGYALLSADGTRALINTGVQLAVINTATGTQAGTTIAGGGNAMLTDDGSRALISTGSNPTRVTVLQIA